jgi:hypothetical protein
MPSTSASKTTESSSIWHATRMRSIRTSDFKYSVTELLAPDRKAHERRLLSATSKPYCVACPYQDKLWPIIFWRPRISKELMSWCSLAVIWSLSTKTELIIPFWRSSQHHQLLSNSFSTVDVEDTHNNSSAVTNSVEFLELSENWTDLDSFTFWKTPLNK